MKNQNKKELSTINGTVGKAILDNKDYLNKVYSQKGDIIEAVKNIFNKEDINNNPYTKEVLDTLKKKKYDDKIFYLYNVMMAGDGLRSLK